MSETYTKGDPVENFGSQNWGGGRFPTEICFYIAPQPPSENFWSDKNLCQNYYQSAFISSSVLLQLFACERILGGWERFDVFC